MNRQMRKNNNLAEFRKSLGLVLVFVGMQFNTAIKNVTLGMDISIVVMLLSALLLVDVKGISKIRMSNKTIVLFILQIFLLLVSIVSNRSTPQLITFHLYLLAIIFALSTNKEYIYFSYFCKILFWISGFIAILVLFQATNGFTGLTISFESTGKLWLRQGGDPITMSRALEFNFITCLFYKKKNKIEKIFTWIFVASDIIGVFSFGNRSVIVCSVVVFLIWYIRYFNREIDVKKMLISFMVIITIVYLGNSVTYFLEKINAIYSSMKKGLGTLFNFGTVSLDPSAQTRVTILSDMKNKFDADFIKNFLMGMGYNYTYVDRPIYQIYFDFGFVGFIFYAYFLLFIPIKTIIGQLKNDKEYNEAWILVVYSMVQTLGDQFLTGLPYYYYLWTPTIFVLFSLTNYKYKNNDIG